jgi:outer membrane protein W
MNYLKLTLAAMLCFCFNSKTFCQTDFVRGYVVLNNNDTLNGFIKQDVEGNLLNKIIFSDNEKGVPNKAYTVNELKAFHFAGGNLYESVHFKDVNDSPAVYFAKYILKGYYSMYSFREKDIEYFLIRHEDTTYFLYGDIILSSGSYDTKGNYENQLAFLSRNCGNLRNSITQLHFIESNIVDFTKKLNDCVAPGTTSSTVAVKSKTKTSFYVYAGALPLGDKFEYTGRALARISTPSISRNLSFNAGVSYSSNQKEEQIYHSKYLYLTHMITGGISAQYNLTTGIVQPYIELGVGYSVIKSKDITNGEPEFQTLSSFNVIAATGLECYITKRLSVKADWRYDFFLHYPTIGVAYFF